MNVIKSKNVTAWAMAALVGLWPGLAVAAGSATWIQPGVDIMEDLTAGLVTLGLPAVGIGIIALAIWGGIAGKLDFMRLGLIVVAGCLITFGGEAIVGLLT